MKLRNCLLLCCFVFATWKKADSFKGLFVMTIGTNSHLNFFKSIVQALAHEGHDMTLLTTRDAKFEEKNIKQILVSDGRLEDNVGSLFNASVLSIFFKTMEFLPKICVNSLQTLIDYEKSKNETGNYDFVIMSEISTECFFGYLYESQVPFMYAFPNVLMAPLGINMGEPEFPSVNPNILTSMSYPLSFSGRILNIFVDMVVTQVKKHISRKLESLARERNLWKPETPSSSEIKTMASFVFINSFKALEKPIKVTTPNVIYAGGIHIKEPKPLPQDLKVWCDDAKDTGFILFSLGSAVKPQDMKDEHREIILKVFGSLKQKVIWKWGAEDIKNLPPNVKLHPWLPQQDILAHPNIRLFISHGGLLSLQEATYFGVPILGIPVFGDQQGNIGTAEMEGWARQLKWDELTEETFSSAVIDTMYNVSIRQEVLRRSTLMKDWNYSPSKEVVFWVEYAVRHKGARHLQSPLATMPWHKIYNMDAWAFIFFVVFSILAIFFLILKCFYNFLKRKLFKVKTD